MIKSNKQRHSGSGRRQWQEAVAGGSGRRQWQEAVAVAVAKKSNR